MKLLKRIISIILVITIMVSTGIFSVNASTVYESENNDSYSTADTITLGDTMSGVLNRGKDEDYYKIIAPASGMISIDFCHTYGEGNLKVWGISIYQYNNGEYKELTYTEIDISDKEKISLPYIGAVNNGIYYVVINSRHGYYEYLTGENYKLSTSFSKSDYYEKEFNDSYSTATPITIGKSYSGNLNIGEDKDYYKIVAPSNGKINIDFCHTSGEGNLKVWGISIYQYSNGEYKELSYIEIDISDNKKISLPYIGAVKGGIYYVIVNSRHGYYEYLTGENYKIKVSLTIPSPTLKTSTNTANGVNLKWNKIKEAKGYIIYRKKGSGKYKQLTKIVGKKKVTYTDKKVKAGKKYTYVVTSYNKNIESKKSNAKTIKYIKKRTK